MTPRVTVRREGGSLAVAIPDEIARRMNLEDGDSLFLVETDHGLALASTSSVLDEDDRAMLDAFEEIAEQYDETLRRLAQ
jgi:putative addiction module antidote